jgi:hypothetical protein
MPIRILKTRNFARDAKSDGLSDDELVTAVDEIESGLVDARLGGFLVKKRISKNNRGKNHGWRAILAHRQGNKIFCLYLFAKGQKENITPKEKLALSELGDQYMRYTDDKINDLVKEHTLIEVNEDDQDQDQDPGRE